MLDINMNAKNHPDWDDKGCDEDARQTWIDEKTDDLMCDYDIVRDALAELSEDTLTYIGGRSYDAIRFNSPHKDEARMRIGAIIEKAIFNYANDIAERQWEVING